MRFRPNTFIDYSGTGGTSSANLKSVFEFLDFMRTASPGGPGWTVPKSSDGVEANIDQDNIAAYADLNQYNAGVSESWFVLEEPTGGRQLRFSRFNTTGADWRVYYSRAVGFSGGDLGNAPSAADQTDIFNADFGWASTSQDLMQHMGADDEAPYDFFMQRHRAGAFTTQEGGLGMFSVEAPLQAGDTDPRVFFWSDGNGKGWRESEMDDDQAAWNVARCKALIPATGTFTGIAALAPEHLPNSMVADANGDELSFPIMFGRSTAGGGPGYKGITQFAQWNGTGRPMMDTYNNKTRISLGDVNVPWDGVTTPLNA